MNINRVVLTGNLTRDPELRTTNNGFSICELGLAVNTRRKNGATGEWGRFPDASVSGGGDGGYRAASGAAAG